MLESYYQKNHEYYFNNYDYKIIQNNLKNIFQNETLKNCILYLNGSISNINSLELLYNINYHSILWNYLNNQKHGMTNGIYQEFKNILFKNVVNFSNDKLNNLMLFNNLMAYVLIILKKTYN